MDDVIRTLEEKKDYYRGRIRAIEERIRKLNQALASLEDEAAVTSGYERPISESPHVFARTPWP